MGLTIGTGPQKGDAWTGFEWVTPARYEELRATSMPSLPPLQPAAPALYEPGGELTPAMRKAAGEGPFFVATPGSIDRAMAEAHDIAEAGKGGDSVRPPFTVDYEQLQRDELLARLDDIHNRCFGVPYPVDMVPSVRDGYPDRLRMEEAFAMILEAVDPEPNRGGLDETPVRAAKAWEFWTSGYAQDPAAVLKVFTDGAEGCDEMVVVHDIPIYSKCEHHLADIVGTCTVGYLPNGKIVGLSKIPRLVNIFARRLQVQERMTNQIANAMMEHLAPHGVGVVIKARHMCMESRGIQQRSTTTTSALRGVFKEDPKVREEFLTLAHKGD